MNHDEKTVLSFARYQEKIMAAVEHCPGILGYRYLTQATAAYLGNATPGRCDDAPGLARLWNKAGLPSGAADTLLTRAALAGDWPVKAAEAMGLSGRAEIAGLARDLPYLDRVYDYSESRAAAADLAGQSPKHAELVSVVWDKLAPPSRVQSLPFAGYIPADERKNDLVRELAGDPFAATLTAYGLPAELTGKMQRRPSLDQREASAPLGPVKEFAEALKKHGLRLEEAPVMDGQWHRVAVKGDGAYQLSGSYRGSLDGRPSGQMVNYRSDGIPVKWQAAGQQIEPKQLVTEKDRKKATGVLREKPLLGM